MNKKSIVTIIGSLHGNERVGAEVIAMLQEEFVNLPNLNLLIGNPAAYEKDKRYLDYDINRLFGEDFSALESADPATLNREEKRALELAKVFRDTNYLLDIHSTLKPSVPFVFCENTEEHLELATLFDPKFIVSPSAQFRPGHLLSSTDSFVDRHGGIGLTYETGWNKDGEKASIVLQKVKRFLVALDLIENKEKPQARPEALHLLVNEALIAQSEHFKFVQNFENFHKFSRGLKIAKDGDRDIVAKEDCYLIFPKSDIKEGTIAAYLAVLNPWT